jgi:CubicO group peptidase (beta-lactamase class C family)
MPTPNHHLQAIVLIAISLSVITAPVVRSEVQRPAAGDVNAKFAALDRVLIAFADQVGASAVTVAVSVKGKRVYSRGFGWSDAARTNPVSASAMMRVASVSKPFTAAMIKDLIRQKKLALDTKVFPYLDLRPPVGVTPDSRLSEVTVQHLLAHKGGWDRSQAFDPMFRMNEISTALDLKGAPTSTDVIRYMLGQPLQFAPGTRSAYSNFGYCVLGRVIEKAVGRPFAEALKAAIADPLDISDLAVGYASRQRRDPREVEYPVSDDAFSLDVMDAHGGIIASAPALCRFMQAYWIDGERRKAGATGLEGEFFGSLPGTTSMVLQRADGIDVAVLLNNRRNGSIGADISALSKAVNEALE